jgi:hypothetical protein
VHRRDYVHAQVDALVIDLEVIRASALGLGVDRSAAPAPRPSTGSAERMVDRLKRTCRSPACVGMPIPGQSPHQERARDRTPHGPPRQILGTCPRRKGERTPGAAGQLRWRQHRVADAFSDIATLVWIRQATLALLK